MLGKETFRLHSLAGVIVTEVDGNHSRVAYAVLRATKATFERRRGRGSPTFTWGGVRDRVDAQRRGL